MQSRPRTRWSAWCVRSPRRPARISLILRAGRWRTPAGIRRTTPSAKASSVRGAPGGTCDAPCCGLVRPFRRAAADRSHLGFVRFRAGRRGGVRLRAAVALPPPPGAADRGSPTLRSPGGGGSLPRSRRGLGTPPAVEALGGSCHGASEQGALRSPADRAGFWSLPAIARSAPCFSRLAPWWLPKAS